MLTGKQHNFSNMKFVHITVILLFCYFGKSDAVCKKLNGKGVSAKEADTIVNRHNEIRLDIANGRVRNQPKSSNMKRMRWDKSLAYAAQKIAETCVFAHVKVTDSRFYFVGQNLYWAASTVNNRTADWKAGIQSWYNEHTTYRYGTSRYDHYTQIVWAETNLVGCGYTYYENRPGWYEKLYVCNYGPGGNIIGQTPYKTGSGCENLC